MSSSSALAKHPQHRISITPHDGVVTVNLGETEIAATSRALSIAEADYPAVFYIPYEDCDAGHFVKSTHTSYCPFKGAASYWTLRIGDVTLENAVWFYQTPFDEVAQIAGHVAFYRDKVEIRESN